ncbi:MAG: Fic family protein [Candidatus Margulisbacteria bacterium]|nr:Fic family protein [Candidatus Margulisiibacteriota bacterium]
MNKPQLLQEIDAKKAKIDAARPLPAIIVDKLKEYYDIEWTYNSNAIEGNTMTRQETMLILKEGLTISGKSMREHLEVTNHKNAIDYLNELLTKVEPITQNDILNIHALILEGINNKYAGKLRDVEVYISGSPHTCPMPDQIPALMLELSKWMVERQEKKELHPVRFAAQAHFKLVDVHPFIDGNGRTARLLMNLILMKYGYPIAVFECETEKRKAYYNSLQIGHEGDIEPFETMVAEYVNATADKYVGCLIPRE